MSQLTTYEYEDGIPEEDRRVLEEKRDAILAALNYNKSVFWKMLKDSRGRKHYQAVEFYNHSKVLCQVVIEDIIRLDDQTLQDRIMRGDFQKRKIR